MASPISNTSTRSSKPAAVATARICASGSPSTSRPGDRADAVDASCRVASIVTCRQAAVAVDAEVVHHGPRGRHRQARPRALHARRRVEPAEPVVEDERLVAPQLLRRGARAPTRPSARNRACGCRPRSSSRRRRGSPTAATTSPFSSMNGSTKPPMQASTCIDAPTDAASSASSRDRVDDALRVLRSRADDQHGVVADAVGHRVDVGAPVRVDVDLVRGHAEVVRGLVERRVRARRRSPSSARSTPRSARARARARPSPPSGCSRSHPTS